MSTTKSKRTGCIAGRVDGEEARRNGARADDPLRPASYSHDAYEALRTEPRPINERAYVEAYQAAFHAALLGE